MAPLPHLRGAWHNPGSGRDFKSSARIIHSELSLSRSLSSTASISAVYVLTMRNVALSALPLLAVATSVAADEVKPIFKVYRF